MAKRYTELEDQFLRDYPDTPIKELADALGRSVESVRSRRLRIGVAKSRDQLYNVDANGNKVPDDMKYCPTCKRVLPLDCFYKAKKGTKGRYGTCKECCHEESKLKHAKQKNKIEETNNLKKELQEKIKDQIFVCPSCKQGRKGSEFGVYGTIKTGIKKASYCRQCEIERDAKRRLKVLKEKGY